jgi:hypothetical protein
MGFVGSVLGIRTCYMANLFVYFLLHVYFEFKRRKTLKKKTMDFFFRFFKSNIEWENRSLACLRVVIALKIEKIITNNIVI